MDNMASAITDKPVKSGIIAHTEVLDNELIEITLSSQASASSTKPGRNHVSYDDMFLDIRNYNINIPKAVNKKVDCANRVEQLDIKYTDGGIVFTFDAWT